MGEWEPNGIRREVVGWDHGNWKSSPTKLGRLDCHSPMTHYTLDVKTHWLLEPGRTDSTIQFRHLWTNSQEWVTLSEQYREEHYGFESYTVWLSQILAPIRPCWVGKSSLWSLCLWTIKSVTRLEEDPHPIYSIYDQSVGSPQRSSHADS